VNRERRTAYSRRKAEYENEDENDWGTRKIEGFGINEEESKRRRTPNVERRTLNAQRLTL
jgi:hypothetical protein